MKSTLNFLKLLKRKAHSADIVAIVNKCVRRFEMDNFILFLGVTCVIHRN